MSIDDTLNLFERFKAATGGDPNAAAMILLAHSQLSAPRNRKPVDRDRLTPPEAAKQLGVSPDTVRGWIASGELKAANVAGPGKRASHRITREALAEFERRRTKIVEPLKIGRRRKPTAQLVQRYSA